MVRVISSFVFIALIGACLAAVPEGDGSAAAPASLDLSSSVKTNYDKPCVKKCVYRGYKYCRKCKYVKKCKYCYKYVHGKYKKVCCKKVIVKKCIRRKCGKKCLKYKRVCSYKKH